MDPGVLCSRDRLEAVARKQPRALEEFESIPEMRRWQVEVLGEGFLRVLHPSGAARSAAPAPATPPARVYDDSPYRNDE
jgi:ribonuclease D